MALATILTDAVVDAQAAIISGQLNGGTIKIYDGVRPASPTTAISGNTLGVTLTFGTPAFGTPASGVITANAITQGVCGNTITPTWARIAASDGTPVMDVAVGATGCNITLGYIASGTVVTCSSFTHDVRNSTAGY